MQYIYQMNSASHGRRPLLLDRAPHSADIISSCVYLLLEGGLTQTEQHIAMLQGELATQPLAPQTGQLPMSVAGQECLQPAQYPIHGKGGASISPLALALAALAEPIRADQLAQLLHLNPLTKARLTLSPNAEANARYKYRYVVGEAADGNVVRGLTAPSEEKRGRSSKIKPLLLEDGQTIVDRVVRVAAHRADANCLMRPEGYVRQMCASELARGKLRPLASFIDDKGDLHDFVARYDGDLIDLLNAPQGAPQQLGLAIGVASEVLRRLAYLHDAGWGHFDVKLENVLWRRDGDLALTDFGEARPLRDAIAGALFGTPGSIAPELLLGRDGASAAADLFGLGIALARLLAWTQLEEVWLHGSLVILSHEDFLDNDLRGMAQYLVQEAVDDYLAYQRQRTSETQTSEGLGPYEVLRAALVDAADPFVASLVVDTLLHPDPAQRGEARYWLVELWRRYPEGHSSHAVRRDMLRQAVHDCSYSTRMDATYSELRAVYNAITNGEAGIHAEQDPSMAFLKLSQVRQGRPETHLTAVTR